jgi:LPXTG-motif cell wall-anchored protein
MGNQRIRRAVRPAVSILAATLLAGSGALAAAPAFAADPGKTAGGFFYVDTPQSVTVLPRAAAGGPGDKYRAFLVRAENDSYDDTGIRNLRLAVDARGLAGKAELQLPAGCAFTDTARLLATCTASAFADEVSFALGVRALPGVTADATGTIKYTATADNAVMTVGFRLTTKVAVGSGPDLAVPQPVGGTQKLAPGASTTFPGTVGNLGDQAADGVVLVVEVTPGFHLSGSYRNCRYGVTKTGGVVSSMGGTVVLCRFEQAAIAPGASYQLSAPFTVSADKDAAYGYFVHTYDVIGGEIDSSGVTGGTAGTGGELTLVPQGGLRSTVKEIDFSNNGSIVRLDTGQSADLAAVGTTASGTVGKPLDLALGIRNVGTAGLYPVNDSTDTPEPFWFSAMAAFSPPAGVTVERVPESCQTVGGSDSELLGSTPLGKSLSKAHRKQLADSLIDGLGRGRTRSEALTGPIYLCVITDEIIPVGGTIPLTFGVKPVKPLVKAEGSLVVATMNVDADPSNDEAAVLVSASTDTGSTGGPTAPTASPTPPAGGSTGSGSGGNDPSGQGAGGGELADTGSSGTGVMVGVGGVAVLLGAGAVFTVSRRRRA